MNSKNTKSSEELKKEVLDDLNKVQNDMNQMEARLTPGQLIDDAISYPGRSVRDTFDHFKSNPVGTAFLTLGTLLLMEDKEHQSYESIVRNSAENVFEKGQIRVAQFKEDSKNKIDSVKSNIKEKISAGKEKLRSAEDSGKETTSNYVQELSPLTYIALGAGLGALTGGSVPVSETEKNLVNDKLGSQFSNLAQDIQDALNQSAKILQDEFFEEIKGRNFKLFKTDDKKFTGLENQ